MKLGFPKKINYIVIFQSIHTGYVLSKLYENPTLDTKTKNEVDRYIQTLSGNYDRFNIFLVDKRFHAAIGT